MIEMIAALNPFLGTITGLVGGWLAKRERRKQMEMEFAHEEKMESFGLQRDQWAHEAALAMADKNIEAAEAEGAIQADIRAAEAFSESQKVSKLTKFGEIVKTCVRPIISGVLMWCSWEIYVKTEALVGGLEGLDITVIQDLFVYIVHAIIFLTITAVSWWFASRGDQAVSVIKGMINRG